MEKEIKSRYYIFMVVLCALFFACGYKVGDSEGYKAGFDVGYRYDCKAEIATLYGQVKAQTKAIAFTDSSMKLILHENDSLKRKEYYQKRFDDSVKYHHVVDLLNDSLCRAVNSYRTNVIQPNGQRNYFVCTVVEKFKKLPECQDDFDIRSKLDGMIKQGKKGKK